MGKRSPKPKPKQRRDPIQFDDNLLVRSTDSRTVPIDDADEKLAEIREWYAALMQEVIGELDGDSVMIPAKRLRELGAILDEGEAGE